MTPFCSQILDLMKARCERKVKPDRELDNLRRELGASSAKNADWLLMLAPMLFIACDSAEDVMLSRFLLSPTLVTEEAVAVAKAATNAKIATCSIAIFQTMVVSALGLFS